MKGSRAAVKLSHRYIPDRQLPDKSVSLLDTACARLALGQNAIPPAIEDAAREIDDYARRDCASSSARPRSASDHARAPRRRSRPQATLKHELATGRAEARWENERDLVNRIREVRGKHRSCRVTGEAAAASAARQRPAVQPIARDAGACGPSSPR